MEFTATNSSYGGGFYLDFNEHPTVAEAMRDKYTMYFKYRIIDRKKGTPWMKVFNPDDQQDGGLYWKYDSGSDDVASMDAYDGNGIDSQMRYRTGDVNELYMLSNGTLAASSLQCTQRNETDPARVCTGNVSKGPLVWYKNKATTNINMILKASGNGYSSNRLYYFNDDSRVSGEYPTKVRIYDIKIWSTLKDLEDVYNHTPAQPAPAATTPKPTLDTSGNKAGLETTRKPPTDKPSYIVHFGHESTAELSGTEVTLPQESITVDGSTVHVSKDGEANTDGNNKTQVIKIDTSGVTFTGENPAPKVFKVPVVIRDANGNEKPGEVSVTVLPLKDKADPSPVSQDRKTYRTTPTEAELTELIQFSDKLPMPEGTRFEFVPGTDSDSPKVKVLYPDGSYELVSVNVVIDAGSPTLDFEGDKGSVSTTFKPGGLVTEHTVEFGHEDSSAVSGTSLSVPSDPVVVDSSSIRVSLKGQPEVAGSGKSQVVEVDTSGVSFTGDNPDPKVFNVPVTVTDGKGRVVTKDLVVTVVPLKDEVTVEAKPGKRFFKAPPAGDDLSGLVAVTGDTTIPAGTNYEFIPGNAGQLPKVKVIYPDGSYNLVPVDVKIYSEIPAVTPSTAAETTVVAPEKIAEATTAAAKELPNTGVNTLAQHLAMLLFSIGTVALIVKRKFA